MKSTQVGGTLTLIAGVLALSQIDPAPSMIVGPDETYTTEVRDRTYANGEESPAIRGNVPPERMRNSRHIDLATARCYLAWSGSPQRLRGRACKRVFRSEIDVYKKDSGTRGGDPLKASAERVKRFYNSLIYDESSPDGEQSPIAEGYDAGHRAKWICKCPECGERQELRFFQFKDGRHADCAGIGGLKDSDDNYVTTETVEKTAHYICINGCRIDQDRKDELVGSGMWVAEGQSIDKEGNVTGYPSRGRRHLSYHIWSIHSPTISFAKIAVAFLEARRDGKLRDFFQNWLGLRYETRKRLPEWNILGNRLAGTYRRGTVPGQCWFLTAGVDVQLDGCYYIVRGWGDQCTSWLVEVGYLQRYETDAIDPKELSEDELNEYFRSDLKQVSDAVLNRYFLIADGERNPLGKDRLKPLLTLIDTGYRTREVHAFVMQQDERRVKASRGEHKIKPQERFKETIVERPQRGGPAYGSPRRVLNVFTPHFKEAIFEKFTLPAGQPGSWNFYHNVVQTSADYLRQIGNERPTEITDKQTGRKRTLWKPRHESWGNHYGDCEVYGFAAAEFLLTELETTWDASTWQKATNGRRRQREPMPTVAVREYQL
jgi:phage terminase large subunit GpA-like protein